MSVMSKSPKVLLLLAMLAAPASGSMAAQQDQSDGVTGSVTDTSVPAPATKGPEIEGIISARSGDRMQVTTAEGAKSVITITDATKISSSGGFLSLSRSRLAAASLLNGLPVSVKTMQSGGELIASQIDLKSKDLKTATMIHLSLIHI